jgi:hypothetical protein
MMSYGFIRVDNSRVASFAALVLSFMPVQPLAICYSAALAELTFGCCCALNTSASA